MRHTIQGLTGLRGIAIILVVLYHFNIPIFSGGFLGVNFFFVISGFIITKILYDEMRDNHQIDFKLFWYKRIKRLLPALFFMLASVTIITAIYYPTILSDVKLNAFFSIFFVSNWFLIFKNVDYFATFSDPVPLVHTWSLAIEEQFYIFFPFLFAIVFKYRNKVKPAKVIFTIVIISAITMAISFKFISQSFAYYSTFSRIFEILIGSSLVFYLNGADIHKLRPRSIKVISTLGSISLVLLFLIVIFVNENTSFMYFGGFIIVDFIFIFLMLSAMFPGSITNIIFENKVLKWFGKRSYSIYLWHYPIIVLAISPANLGNQKLYVTIILFLIILLISNFSYKYIELPIIKSPSNFITNHRKTLILLVIVIATGLTTFLIPTSIINKYVIAKPEQNITAPGIIATFDNLIKAPDSYLKHIDETYTNSIANKEILNQKNILVLGDSIALDIETKMESEFDNVVVDGQIGRQMYQILDLSAKYSSYNNANSIIILCIGTNGTFPAWQINEFINTFDQAQIYLVNTQSTTTWEQSANNAIETAAKEHANTTLVDWNKTSESHPEYFASDGVHLTQTGINNMFYLIQKTIIDSLNK